MPDQSVILRVNAPATMPNRNALESARKRNVPTSSSEALSEATSLAMSGQVARYFRLISADVSFVSRHFVTFLGALGFPLSRFGLADTFLLRNRSKG